MKRRISLLFLSLFLLAGCQATPAGAPETAGPQTPEPPISSPASPALAEEMTAAVPETPDTASFFLTYWDGEVLLKQFCYSQAEAAALAQTLPEVRGLALESWTAPEDPWPIYGLQIGGVEEDFEAAYCGGVWLDSQGHILQADVDFPALWEQFAKDPKAASVPYPAARELALASGAWDTRFLTASELTPSEAAPMALALSEDGVSWTITNQTGTEIFTGDGSAAVPQVLLDGVWYSVPTLSGQHFGWNSIAVSTPNGETFSGTLWREPYSPLPNGEYRLALHWTTDAGRSSLACAPFRVQNGVFSPAEA